LGSPSEQKIN